MYNFPVIENKIFTSDNIEIPKRKAITRPDTNEVLSIVGTNYRLMKHEKVIDIFNEKLEKEPDQINLTTDGGVMFAKYSLPSLKSAEVAKGDIIDFSLRVFNSYNMLTSTGFEVVGKRLVCMNGMTVPKSMASFSFKHLNNDGIHRLTDSMFNLGDTIGETVDIWKKWTHTTPSYHKIAGFYDMLDINNDIKIELLNKSYPNNTFTKTTWDHFNVLTKYTTHEMKNRGKNSLVNQRKKEADYTNLFYTMFRGE